MTQADDLNWFEARRLSFCINLYNASTLRLVLDHYPVASIKKIGGSGSVLAYIANHQCTSRITSPPMCKGSLLGAGCESKNTDYYWALNDWDVE